MENTNTTPVDNSATKLYKVKLFFKLLLQQSLRMLGLNKKSKFVVQYINNVNVRSGIFMGVVVMILEVWLIIRTFNKYIIPNWGPTSDFFFIMGYISYYILFFLVGLAITVFCYTYTTPKVKNKTKFILNLVCGGLVFLYSFYIFKEPMTKIGTNESGMFKYYVQNSLLIALYVVAFLLGGSIIAFALLNKFNKTKFLNIFVVAVIVLFGLMCLAFGIRVSYSDHARVYVAATGRTHNEIICFLTMTIYFTCLLVWRPWISLIVNTLSFVLMFAILKGSDNFLTEETMQFAFSGGDAVNLLTFLISITMVSIMMYYQRFEAAEKDEILDYTANFDVLTDLHTFSYFVREVDLYQTVTSGQKKDRIILYMNIGDFKLYNDQKGFVAGNEFLKNIGKVLEKHFPDAIISRQSDDHYAIFASTNNYQDNINNAHQEILHLDKDIEVEAFFGGYIVTKDSEDARRMVDKARYACSVISEKRNKVYLEYDLDMHKGYHLMQYVIHNVDKAAENDWIKPYYQPVVRSTDGKLCGVEALARWEDPKYGFLSPGQFIPTLEATKLVHKVDAHIIEYVCRDIRFLLDNDLPAVPVSINFSRLDFELMDAVGILDDYVSRYNIPKDLLHVEITESALMDDTSLLPKAVKALKDKGYALWLDDFGSGYSSLNVLKDYEFDVIKIDMVFLRNFEGNLKSKVIIGSIMSMAKALGMDTLCEGVETEEQRDFLKSINCERLQGYLFGRALPLEDLIKKIENNKFIVCKEYIKK